MAFSYIFIDIIFQRTHTQLPPAPLLLLSLLSHFQVMRHFSFSLGFWLSNVSSRLRGHIATSLFGVGLASTDGLHVRLRVDEVILKCRCCVQGFLFWSTEWKMCMCGQGFGLNMQKPVRCRIRTRDRHLWFLKHSFLPVLSSGCQLRRSQ